VNHNSCMLRFIMRDKLPTATNQLMIAAWVDRAYWISERDVQSSSKVWIKWHISFIEAMHA